MNKKQKQDMKDLKLLLKIPITIIYLIFKMVFIFSEIITNFLSKQINKIDNDNKIKGKSDKDKL